MISRRIVSIFMVFFTLFLTVGSAFAEDPQLPNPVGDIYIQDFAGVLTEQEKMEVRSMGRSIEDQTTAQIAVLTVDFIGDTTVEEFANEALRHYGIGNEVEDNGVLMVIGMNPSPGMTKRPLRIEVGYGLEGRLPDGKVGRIIDEVTIPYLENDQHNRAIIETYKVLANEVLAEYGIEEGQHSIEQPIQQPRPDEGLGIPLWLLIPIVIIVVILDLKYFGGFLTHLLFTILSRGRGGGGDGPRGGGGGSSGGGGASRGW
jgi:uncharacterized protein